MATVCTQAAQASGDFYAGKTIKIVIGTNVGGEFGVYGQLIGRQLGRFIPGHPTLVVQTMPGAGGMLALNYLASAAPKDGTVLAIPHVNMVQDGLLNPKARFNPGQFQWIGRIAGMRQVGVASAKSNARSLADAKSRELIAGGAGVNNPMALNARILNALAGTRFKIVTGYKGAGDVALAWERGEVDMMTISWDIVMHRYGNQLKAGLIHPLFVFAMRRPAELADVPSVLEFGGNDAENAFLQIYGIATEIGRSLMAPPGVPKERIAVLRAAFSAMLSDETFRDVVSKSEIRFEPADGESVASSVAAVVGQSRSAIAAAREFYQRLLDEVR
jgi:tripartite-type tricarboxylate transporter receptor subunit TctC